MADEDQADGQEPTLLDGRSIGVELGLNLDARPLYDSGGWCRLDLRDTLVARYQMRSLIGSFHLSPWIELTLLWPPVAPGWVSFRATLFDAVNAVIGPMRPGMFYAGEPLDGTPTGLVNWPLSDPVAGWFRSVLGWRPGVATLTVCRVN